ncbi:MAG: Flp pilus assembly protein CpaB [Oligoflexia bacterium]|nr:Flp pilus assembly protein CpaB [Oligoflexia bacterium]
MNTRAFSLALIIAGIAMFMVYTYIEDQKSEITKTFGENVTVLVAKRDINELELLDDTKVNTITVPKKFRSPGSFSSIKEIENTLATVPIMKGEQLTKPRITYPGANTGLAQQVSVGKRAIAINITERQAVSKLIKPGDRVDVLAAIDYSSGRKDMQKATTILQDVLVLSTGYNMSNSVPIYGIKIPSEIKKMKANIYTRYNTVTLELTPYEVQKLVFLLVFSGNKPFLSLRNNNDTERVNIRSSDIFDVIGNQESVEAKAYFNEQNKKRAGR